MSLFPYYQPADIDALNAQAVTLLKLFGARGYAREEPSVLQPASAVPRSARARKFAAAPSP